MGAGHPLDQTTRDYFEPRFGIDFSHVRVHAGQQAAQSANSVNALAYTLGRDVVFGAGQYQPQTIQGKRLLAHELAHVVQQGSGIAGTLQRTVNNVYINCAADQIYFEHDGETTSYSLDHCNVSDGTYDAGVRLSSNRVDFDLGVAPEGTQFDFHYSIRPGQPNPNTFFAGQSRVNITCTHVPGVGNAQRNFHFSVHQLSPQELTSLTGATLESIPERVMIPLSSVQPSSSSPSVLGPAGVGAAAFSPTPWSFIPRNSTGISWIQGHTSIWANPEEGLFSFPTIRGYRGNMGNYLGELLPVVGRNFTIRLHEGVPGSFANDLWFPLMPGEQSYLYVPRDRATAAAFAARLRETQYGGTFTYSPPRGPGSPVDPVLGPVGRTEAELYGVLTARGRAPMCTNNCITVPGPEIVDATGMRPTTPSGIDVMSGTRPDGVVDPVYRGRGRLMTEATSEGPLMPGVQRLRVTPGASAGMFLIRGGGTVLLVYGIYQTEERVRAAAGTDQLTTVVAEETGSWTGGILGSALGGAAAGAIFCAPTGPIDAVCVVGGFLGGLLFGAVGSALGSEIGHTAVEGRPPEGGILDRMSNAIEEPFIELERNLEFNIMYGGVPW